MRAKIYRSLIISIVFIIVISGTAVPIKNIHSTSNAANPLNTAEIVKGEYIIKWNDGYQQAILETADILDWDSDQNIMRVKLKKEVAIANWINEWKNNPNIEYIQPNYIVKISEMPNDTNLNQQSYLQQINAEQAWEVTAESPVIIAILDTGIDLNHLDLKNNLVEGINLIDKEKLPQDGNGHGTNIAGIVGAVGNNAIGISGVVWKSRIMPIKVLNDEEGKGNSFLVGQGIKYAVDNGAGIILLSAGEPNYSPFMAEAVNYAEANGVVVIAAAGNESRKLNYPAAFSNVISVGAVDNRDRYLSYSNYGQQLDVVAPGDRIYTTKLGGDYTINSGTSMAAPQVAGLAALLLQVHPNLSPKEVSDILKFSADDVAEEGWDNKTGFGRINMNKALRLPLSAIVDGYEPNNTFSASQMFPLEDTFNAQLEQTDADWYMLELPYAGTVTIDLLLNRDLDFGVLLDVIDQEQLANLPIINQEQAITDIQNQNENTGVPENESNSGTLETNLNNPPDGAEQIDNLSDYYQAIGSYLVPKQQSIVLDLPKGVYYLYLRMAPELLATIPQKVSYSISTHFQIYEDSFESNDRPWQAYSLENVNQKIVGTLSKDFDEDWYRIRLLKSGTLTATIKVDTSAFDPILLIKSKESFGREFDFNDSGKEEFAYINATPGDYYIRVSDYNSYRIIGEYTLEIKFKSDQNDFNEPNDLSREATPLDLTARIYQGIISETADYDWFTFTLNQPHYLTLDFAAGQQTELIFYNNDLQALETINALNWKYENVLAEGKYYLRAYSEKQENTYTFQFKGDRLYGNFVDIANHWARETIVKLYQEGLLTDSPDYYFYPDQYIKRGEVAAILQNTTKKSSAAAVNFSDVPKDNELYSAIAAVVNGGLMSGYLDNTFRPYETLRREEVIPILLKTFEIPLISDLEQQFTDVEPRNSAYQEINTFSVLGILSDDTYEYFRPSASITKAEFVDLFQRAKEYKENKEINENNEIIPMLPE